MSLICLEYSSGVWDLPHLQKDIDNVERVNRRAARFVLGDHRQQSISVSVMMEKLQWPTLEHRKNQRLTTMFKVVYGLVYGLLSGFTQMQPPV